MKYNTVRFTETKEEKKLHARLIEIDLCYRLCNRQLRISYASSLYAVKSDSNDLPICAIIHPEFFSAFNAKANESAAMTKIDAVAEISTGKKKAGTEKVKRGEQKRRIEKARKEI